MHPAPPHDERVFVSLTSMAAVVAAMCLLIVAPQRSAAADHAPVRDVGEAPTVPASGGDSEDACRLYAAKILGITFAHLRTSAVHAAAPPSAWSPAWNSPTSTNGSLFTGALAAGVRVPLDVGAVRLECEGALRDNFNPALNPDPSTSIGVSATDNWSVLTNAWRDVPLTRHLGAYAGGGIGGGGYALEASGPGGSVASRQAEVFAWQAGGGAVWRYNAQIDFDVSYRYLDLGQINATLSQPGAGSVGTLSSKMSAGELFFMLRVYDPFQWRTHLTSRSFYLPD